MIHSVLGEIDADKLGITLMHEHITWDSNGAESTAEHNIEDVVDTILPYLLDLKNSGCSTFVDASTFGSGRDIDILIECSKRSGLNILTNVGAWDGSNNEEKFIPSVLKGKSIDEITAIWSEEFLNGIDSTDVKPAYIKIALGDTGVITGFQEKILRATARTSIKTHLPIQCHALPANSAIKAVKIIEEENLPLNKFIWVHADFEKNYEVIMELARKDSILPYDRIFKEFIPYCTANGISSETIHKLLIENPRKVLNID